MGRSAARKAAEIEEQEFKIQQNLKQFTKKTKEKPIISNLIEETGIYAYKKYWFRDPYKHKIRSHNEDRIRKEFIKWVFLEYPVPEFMYKAWTPTNANCYFVTHHEENREKAEIINEQRTWFITIARGASLYKTQMKNFMTKKEVHLFLNSSDPKLSIKHNLWMAKLIAMGASVEHAKQILQTSISLSINVRDNKYWIDICRFFIVNDIKGLEMVDILDFLRVARANNPNFSIQGRTKESVIRLSNNWHMETSQKKTCRNRTWRGLDIPLWTCKRKVSLHSSAEPYHRTWKIEQILTEKRLVSEGNKMGHCVSSYADKCVNGSCGIFHLNCDDSLKAASKLTIEVRNKKIVQVRGKFNRSPDKIEQNILNIWGRENNLQLDCCAWWR